MKDFTLRLAPFSLIIVGIICLSSIAMASANADNSGLILGGARVTPENGTWGSTFTFTVTYTDDNGSLPTPGYPKIYLDGTEMVMEESDPADNDVTDGKVYHKSWMSVKENVGLHDFYFYVETSSGENIRNPETGTYEGPMVKKQSVSLTCEIDNPEPAVGENVTFSGYVTTTEENLGIAGENLILYELLLDNEVSASSAITSENGYFILQLNAPSSGIFCYRARFLGDNYYDASGSSNLYVNTLDKPLVFGVYAVVLLALLVVAMFLLSRGIDKAHYLIPILLGFVLGFFLLIIGAGFIGIVAAGAISGYLFAKKTPKWITHLRIGCMVGFLFLLVDGLLFAYFLAWTPELLGLRYSVTQTGVSEFLVYETSYSMVNYVLMIGMGAVLGGMLRKLLKPRAQKPPDGSEETTSSGVEQK